MNTGIEITAKDQAVTTKNYTSAANGHFEQMILWQELVMNA